MNNFKNKKREKWSEDSFQAEDAAQNPFFFREFFALSLSLLRELQSQLHVISTTEKEK